MQVIDVLHPVIFYNPPHLAIIGVLWSAAVILAIFLSKKYGYTKKVIWACLIITLLCELEKIIFFIEDTGNGFRFPAEILPFNLCTIQIFFIIALVFSTCQKKDTVLISFMFPALISGAFVGMVIPSATFDYHGLLDIATYRYFIYHSMLIFLGLYLYLSKPILFSIKSLGYAFLIILLIMIFGVWINAFFGWDPRTNFCFLVRPPTEGLPLLNMNNGWLGYVGAQALICVLLFSLCYLPMLTKIIREKLNAGKAK